MNLRELKYVIYGEDRLSNKLNKITGASRKTTAALGHHNTQLSKLKKNFKGAAAEIPGLSHGMAVLSNPIAIGAAATIGLVAGLNKATNAAATFNNQFLELKNLNLDKTKAQIDELRDRVLNLSFREGFNAEQTSTGFFDVQSILGEYGAAQEAIVRKTGKFAQVFKSNFNETIAGTAKGMKNFGFGVQDLDKYFASAFKTVQTGVTTYDQLFKVQSDFAGAASGAKQSFDSANKLFAIFTARTKSVNEAATLTKSAFTDMFKAPSVSSFKQIGIDLFDVNGKAKQVDQIMKELNAKFMMADSDEAVNSLRNQFKGSEGLIQLVNVASDKNGEFIKTFDTFDKSEFGFNKALKSAKNDLNIIDDQLKNKIHVAVIGLGDAFLPFKIGLEKQLIGSLDRIAVGFYEFSKNMLFYKMLFNTGTKEEQEKYANQVMLNRKKSKIIATGSTIPDFADMTKKEYYENLIGLSSSLVKRKEELPNLKEGYRKQVARGDIAAYEELITTLKSGKDIVFGNKKITTQTDSTINDTTKPTGGDPPTEPGGTKDNVQDGINAISGGGTQVRNVNVNVGKFFDNLNIETNTLPESTPQIKEMIEEMFVRVLQGSEQVLN